MKIWLKLPCAPLQHQLRFAAGIVIALAPPVFFGVTFYIAECIRSEDLRRRLQ
jgi:hypothetical protein